MKIATVYDLEMAKLVHLQIGEKTISVEADTIEMDNQDPIMLALKKDGTKVGEFRKAAVSGWWIQDLG